MSKRGAREGSIYKRQERDARGKLRIRWVGAVSDGGKRKVVYGKRREDVAEKMKALLGAQQKGTPINPGRQSVAAYLTKWSEGASATVRPSTWYRYNQLIRGHLIPRLGSIGLAKLQPADCAGAFAVMSAAGLAPRTIVQARAILGRALREAEIAGLVGRNAARLTRPPSVTHAEMKTLTAEQSRLLIDGTADDRAGAFYAVALASGAREGELLALKWADVDWERGSIKIRRTLQRMSGALTFAEPKTASSRRTVTLGQSTMRALRRQQIAQAEERLRNGLGKAAEDDVIFCTEAGTPIDAGNFLSRTHYPTLQRLGLPRIRVHDLRHTNATLLLESGMHPRVVAERLGHATPALVMNIYGHVTERMQKDATAALERVLGA